MDPRIAAARQYDSVIATYSPRRADDLQSDGIDAIGWRGDWLAAWCIEGGRYAGQLAWVPRPPGSAPIGWVPSEDLIDARDV